MVTAEQIVEVLDAETLAIATAAVELAAMWPAGYSAHVYNGTLICVTHDREMVGYLNRRYDFPAGRALWVASLPTHDSGVVCATAVEAARRLIDRVQALEIGAAA